MGRDSLVIVAVHSGPLAGIAFSVEAAVEIGAILLEFDAAGFANV